jgi:molybdopterin converting factor subunit 1
MTDEQIQVTVKFFAAPREAMDQNELKVEIPKATTVEELLDLLKKKYPVLRSYVRFLSVAVNRAYVGMGTELHDGDIVACLPPVGGG